MAVQNKIISNALKIFIPIGIGVIIIETVAIILLVVLSYKYFIKYGFSF